MTSRERVRRAVEFDTPDRVPVMHSALAGAWHRYGDALFDIMSRYPSDLGAQRGAGKAVPLASGQLQGDDCTRALLRAGDLEDDFVHISPRHFLYGPALAPGLSSDEWGCVWQRIDLGMVGQVVAHPLDSWQKLASYRFPDPLAYWRWDRPSLEKAVDRARQKGKYIVAYAGRLFERLQWLRGYENLMLDLVDAPDEMASLIERVCDYLLGTIAVLSEYRPDSIYFSDDWGTQRQLMISPGLWQGIFKPCYQKLFKAVHDAGAHVYFHTDGYTLDILPDLMEIGVDILNPQFSCMDLEKLSDLVKGRVCIRTDLDRQHLLPKGEPGEVKEYVRKVFDLLGTPQGGIIAAGELAVDSSLANIEAMYQAFEEYGKAHTYT